MISCGGYQGPGSVHTRAMRALADGLGGSFLENVTADGSKATDLFARVERGALDLCYFASSYLAERVPELLGFDLPFTFPDRAAAFAAFDGALGRVAAEAVRRRTGFVVLGLWDNGVRHISNRARPLAAPADCAGLRLRTMDNRLHQDVFRSFGFDPVTIDVRDLPEAVRAGMVDGQENPLTNTVNFGLHRSHRFHSLTGHLFGVALLLANRAWYEGLEGNVRFSLDRAVSDATALQRQFAAEEDANCLDVLRADGCEVLGPDALDLASFRRAAAPVREAALAGLDPAVRAALPAG